MTTTELPRVLDMPKLTSMQMSIVKFVQDTEGHPDRGFRNDWELPQTFSFEELRKLIVHEPYGDFLETLQNSFPSMLIWFHMWSEPAVVNANDVRRNIREPRLHRVRVFVQRIKENETHST